MGAGLMLTKADKLFYQTAIDSALFKLERHYKMSFTAPQVQWTLRGKSKLGLATGDGRTVKFNRQYAEVLGRDLYLETVLHEVCHIVTTQRRNQLVGTYGRPSSGPWSSHGAEWKGAMRLLGLSPQRCASISSEIVAKIAPARKVVRHNVYCLCEKPHRVTTQMLNKVNKGASMRCNTCKVVVTPYAGVLAERFVKLI